MKSLTTLSSNFTTYAQNTSTDIISLGKQQINDTHRYLLQKYFNNESSATDLTEAQVQFYPVPANYSKMKTVTVTNGVLKWTLTEILTRREWDQMNVFPYYSDIPVNFFIYNNNQVGIWPIPSSAGNTITYNYKIKVPDLTFADWTTGTMTTTANSTAVTLSGATGLLANYLPAAGSAINLNLYIQPTAPKGDNNWYQISSIASDGALTLANTCPSTFTGASFTIGQMPLIQEDFHDLLVYRPLMLYFSSIQADAIKAEQFKALYQEGEVRLAEYSGTKTIDVNLDRKSNNNNPNLFWQG